MEHRRISVAGVVASSSGSMVAACAVLLTTGLAFANPPTITGIPKNYDQEGGPNLGLDLPMMAPVFGETKEPYEKPPHNPTLPPRPEETSEEDGDDPRDTPPPTFFGEELDSEKDSILYVIDNSGSMSIVSEPFEDQNGSIVSDGNRLDRAKAELKRSIGALPESFHFNVMFYDECVMTLWPAKQAATSANKQTAFAWIDAVQPDGWTNTGLAVQTALQDKDNLSIVLLSDGAPNFLDCAMNYVGSFAQHEDLIQKANTQGARIDTFGIGISSDPEARGFMQRVASASGGTYSEID